MLQQNHFCFRVQSAISWCVLLLHYRRLLPFRNDLHKKGTLFCVVYFCGTDQRLNENLYTFHFHVLFSNKMENVLSCLSFVKTNKQTNQQINKQHAKKEVLWSSWYQFSCLRSTLMNWKRFQRFHVSKTGRLATTSNEFQTYKNLQFFEKLYPNLLSGRVTWTEK